MSNYRDLPSGGYMRGAVLNLQMDTILILLTFVEKGQLEPVGTIDARMVVTKGDGFGMEKFVNKKIAHLSTNKDLPSTKLHRANPRKQ